MALVDSAETTALAVAEALEGEGLGSYGNAGGAGATRFFATDSPERFARVGEIFLGRPIDALSVELVDGHTRLVRFLVVTALLDRRTNPMRAMPSQ